MVWLYFLMIFFFISHNFQCDHSKLLGTTKNKLKKCDDDSRNFKSRFTEIFWLLTSYWGQARERYTNIIVTDIKSLGSSKSCWNFIIYGTQYHLWCWGNHKSSYRSAFRKKKFSRHAVGTRPQVKWEAISNAQCKLAAASVGGEWSAWLLQQL